MSEPEVVGPVEVPTLPPSIEQFLSWNPQPVPLLPVLAVVLAFAYVAGTVRLRSQKRSWPLLRTLSFLSGCGLLFVVTGLGIEGYGLRMFSVFVFQQMTLMLVVPPLLILGSPGRLLLRSMPHHGAGRLLLRAAICGLRSPVSRALLHPALVVPLLLLSLFGLYLSGVADVLLRSFLGHVGLELSFLIIGVLLATPLVSADPLPGRISYPARAFDAFMEMQAHAAFGLVLTLAAAPLVPFFAALPPGWGLDPLMDQWWAGGMAWAYGELPVIAILIATLARWQRSDRTRAAKRRSRDDDDLAAYNEYLKALHARDRRDAPRTPE